jgi:DNA-binding NarL/FixJ family response regulator
MRVCVMVLSGDNKISILIAEDHKLLRQAYATALCNESNFRIIALAANGKELLEQASALIPDVVITGIQLPVMAGFEVIKQLKLKQPGVRVIFLGALFEHSIPGAFHSGACACLDKNCSLADLVQTINSVYKDDYCVSGHTAGIILGQAKTNQQVMLSQRELEVMRLICEEKTNRQISEKLHVSVATVDYYRQQIYKKTNLSSVIGLVKYAIRNGIASADMVD